jgi:hypothetical protein
MCFWGGESVTRAAVRDIRSSDAAGEAPHKCGPKEKTARSPVFPGLPRTHGAAFRMSTTIFATPYRRIIL